MPIQIYDAKIKTVDLFDEERGLPIVFGASHDHGLQLGKLTYPFPVISNPKSFTKQDEWAVVPAPEQNHD